MQFTPESNSPLGLSLLEDRDISLVLTGVEGADRVQPIILGGTSRDPLVRPKVAEILQSLRQIAPVAAGEVRAPPGGGHVTIHASPVFVSLFLVMTSRTSAMRRAVG